MIILALLTALFLALMLGRNNLSNLFGPAIGTRMIPFNSSVSIAAFFVLAGAIFSGDATTENVSRLGTISMPSDILVLCVSAGIILFILTKTGIPASITQTTTGAYVAWNLFYNNPLPHTLLIQTISAWIYTPIIAAVLAFFGLKLVRCFFKHFSIHLLIRDKIVRIGLLCVGAFSAYALGANNIGSIIGPFMYTFQEYPYILFYTAGLMIAIGFFFADKRVIKTVSSGMFPLTPTEALVVVFMSALTLILFSSIELKNMLISLSLPSFPLVPIPLSSVSIGAIFGIALSKGIAGLKFKRAGAIICSWFVAPIGAGLICYGLLHLFVLGVTK